MICLPAYGQIKSPLISNRISCDVGSEWNCDPDSVLDCGTFMNPARMRLTIGACPDSFADENFIYVWESLKSDKNERIKNKTFRNVYFVTKGFSTDSFVVNLDGTELLFLQKDSDYIIKITKQGIRTAFHLDINIPRLNMSIATMDEGILQKIYRRPKRK